MWRACRRALAAPRRAPADAISSGALARCTFRAIFSGQRFYALNHMVVIRSQSVKFSFCDIKYFDYVYIRI